MQNHPTSFARHLASFCALLIAIAFALACYGVGGGKTVFQRTKTNVICDPADPVSLSHKLTVKVVDFETLEPIPQAIVRGHAQYFGTEAPGDTLPTGELLCRYVEEYRNDYNLTTNASGIAVISVPQVLWDDKFERLVINASVAHPQYSSDNLSYKWKYETKTPKNIELEAILYLKEWLKSD